MDTKITDIMIDLETFSTAPYPAIVQIGAVGWNMEVDDYDGHKRMHFSANASLQSSILAGGDFDESTADWWRDQTQAARESISCDASPLWLVLRNFREWFESMAELGVKRVWSHGAATDLPWLAAAYWNDEANHQGLVPWQYQMPRDTRTIFELAEMGGWQPTGQDEQAVQHNALDDALWQAHNVWRAFRYIQRCMESPYAQMPEGEDQLVKFVMSGNTPALRKRALELEAELRKLKAGTISPDQ